MGRRAELSDRVDRLVAGARARRIREAWTEAARVLGLTHRRAPRLFDDVLEGVLSGVPVRAVHLPLRDTRRLHLVVEVDSLGALPLELSMQGAALLEAFDRLEGQRAVDGGGEIEPASSRRDGPPSSVYRQAPGAELDAGIRAWLCGTEDAMGASVRGGKVVYQHAAPLEDGPALASLLTALVMVASTLVRSSSG